MKFFLLTCHSNYNKNTHFYINFHKKNPFGPFNRGAKILCLSASTLFEDFNTIHFEQNVRVEVEKINGQKLLLDYHQKIIHISGNVIINMKKKKQIRYNPYWFFS
jgi:hypothetical protein